ncbi:DUF998 domain-containing protein [Porphyrobacter sp. HT-58-2]|uniref:DUF998 domain-containing protein n=1 Tax=Porphyrobacter sp. HT-58-2 TaxID=2023229 RepID=UPI0030016238
MHRSRRQAQLAQSAATIGIVLLVSAMIIGPAFAPPAYDWLRHTTSQQAGQAMPGAWIMRAGFAGFGVGTLVAALAENERRRLVRQALAIFGAGMVAAAIWSHAPITAGMAADLLEDKLHSLASAIVGTAFAGACAASLFAKGGSRGDLVAWIGLAIAVVIPLAMNQWPAGQGLLQRLMFLYSCAFILREFYRR